MTYVLSTIGDRTYVINDEQYESIVRMIEAGMPKAFRIGRSLVVLSQITGIDPLDTYLRQMKMKLAAKKLRMCRRCGTIVPINDVCPCKDQPEKYRSLLDQARLENPELARQLDQIAEKKAIPSLAPAA